MERIDVAVGVEGATGPSQFARRRRQSRDEALHGGAVDDRDRLPGGVVRIDGDVGHVEDRADRGLGSGEGVEDLGLRALRTP